MIKQVAPWEFFLRGHKLIHLHKRETRDADKPFSSNLNDSFLTHTFFLCLPHLLKTMT